MVDMTATTMATYLNEVWSPLMTITYRMEAILPPLMDRRWEPEIGVGMGDTVNIPNFSQNSRSNVTARSTFGTGAAVTFIATTESQTQLLVNRMGTYCWRMPFEMSLQTQNSYMREIESAAPQALARYVDYLIASDDTDGFDSFTAIGTDNVDVGEDIVVEGEKVLNESIAPLQGRIFVFSPATYSSLKRNEVYRNQLFAGTAGNLSGNKGPGYVGHIESVDCYMHADLEAGTSGKKNYMGHREAIAYAEQTSVRIEQATNITDGGFREYMAYNVFGFKKVKSTFGREVDGK